MRIATITRLTALFVAALIPCAVTAHAQKPALTQNIDEKGRVPYHSSNNNNCNLPNCTVSFSPVPSGYRLVITDFSMHYIAGAQSTIYPYQLSYLEGGAGSPSDTRPYRRFLPTPVYIGAGYEYVSSGSVTYYVDALGTPSLVAFDNLYVGFIEADINGYLVNLNQ